MLPYINAPFSYVAGNLGASVDELKLITSFLLSYPFAGVLKRIPDSKPYQKNVFIIAVSVFYLVGLFDLWSGVRTLLISSVGAYAIAAFIEGPFMPWIGFIFLMGHLSVNHIYRQFINAPDKVDITGAQMVLIMKLTAFCWNVHDGRLPQKDLSDFQKERALPQLPSILDYAAYVLFFPSLFAGPAFDYVEYRRWIETTMFEVPPGMDPSKMPPTRKKRKIPRSGTPAAWKAAAGIFWILAFLKFSTWYNNDLVLGTQYMRYGFLRRVWILEMLGFTARLKYYGVWALTEGSCILSGIGYKGVDPKTGKVQWNRLQNVNPWGIESAQNSRAYLENWNMNTNNWLRNYMYLRVTPKGRKPGFRASLATFVTRYTSLGRPLKLIVFEDFRRHVRPFFLTPDGKTGTPYKRYYDILSYFATQTAFCFTTAPFVLLTMPNSLLVWARVYFYCLIGVAASMAFFASSAKPWLIKELAKRNNSGLQRTLSQESLQEPMHGLPNDPGQEFDEILKEVREEVEARRRKGITRSETVPEGTELKAGTEKKLGKRL
ncbi:MAG: lysophospholipid acyltransferase [Pycnora praestabilis]|nr:MAG: lysophospholipid acyltransferase [Pycnora praestabilis]